MPRLRPSKAFLFAGIALVGALAAGAGRAPHWRAEMVLSLGEGAGARDVGFLRPDEASPEGPMSFAVGAAGDVFVLDQVNARILVLPREGAPHSIPLPRATFQDLAPDAGGFALLDRLAAGTIVRVDAAGKVRGEFTAARSGAPDPATAAALLVRPDGFWLAYGGGWLGRVADADGRPGDARAMPGVPAPDGRHVRATLARDRRSVHVVAYPPRGRPRRLATVPMEKEAAQVDAIEVGADGRVYLAVRLAADVPSAAQEQVVVLGGSGREETRVAVQMPERPEERLRVARLGEDGNFYVLATSEGGLVLWRVVR